MPLNLKSSAGGSAVLNPTNNASDYVITIPNVTDTLVGKNTTDTLTNKTLVAPVISGPMSYRRNVIINAVSANATLYATHVLTASLTLTLPASPVAGDWIEFSNRSGTLTAVIARNGNNIMGSATDLTLNTLNYGARLVYVDSTNGWIIL